MSARPELSTLMARTQSGYELDVTTLLCLANDEEIAQRPDAASAHAQLSYLAPTPNERSGPRARVTVPVPMFLLTGEHSTNR